MDQIKRPSWWLNEILSGRMDLTDAPPSVQSWARFPIYQGAAEIVGMEYKGEREAALAKVPHKIRPYVEAEARRIWPMRKNL